MARYSYIILLLVPFIVVFPNSSIFIFGAYGLCIQFAIDALLNTLKIKEPLSLRLIFIEILSVGSLISLCYFLPGLGLSKLSALLLGLFFSIPAMKKLIHLSIEFIKWVPTISLQRIKTSILHFFSNHRYLLDAFCLITASVGLTVNLTSFNLAPIAIYSIKGLSLVLIRAFATHLIHSFSLHVDYCNQQNEKIKNDTFVVRIYQYITLLFTQNHTIISLFNPINVTRIKHNLLNWVIDHGGTFILYFVLSYYWSLASLQSLVLIPTAFIPFSYLFNTGKQAGNDSFYYIISLKDGYVVSNEWVDSIRNKEFTYQNRDLNPAHNLSEGSNLSSQVGR